jgi:uncharacterized membrane protein YedE/YeeE
MNAVTLTLWAGFALGIAFGVTVQRTGFCLNTGLRGFWVSGDRRMIRSFALALAVAILLSQAIHAFGIADLQKSLYPRASISWLLMPLGGMLFGYGMVAANACGARSLVLLGQGNLRSFLVLLCLGISAYIILSGLLAPLRVALAAYTSVPFASGSSSLVTLLGLATSSAPLRLLPAIAIAAPLLWFVLSSPEFRASPKHVAGGVLVGLIIPAGWIATGWLGNDDFEPAPVASLTFIAPVGETIQYAMLASGQRMTFGVAIVCGVFLGALVSALVTREFKLDGFSRPGQMLRYMAGGALMGLGGALALGCSIGQGLTGLSTLALGSFLSAAGIVAGVWVALKSPLRLPPLQ